MATTTTDLIQTLQSTSGQGPRFRPFASSVHHVTKGRYITSNDPRGYIPVYEYPLNSQWIMMDIDDGYILWTGIWKALGNSKADIVKMIDSQPELAQVIRRVRGGYLKIQGTWMPFEVALRLARRVAWNIREDLIPLFGPTFPSTCLSPDQPGYGQVVASTGRRRARRNAQPLMPMIPAPDNRLLNGQPVSLHQPSVFVSAPPLSNYAASEYPSTVYSMDVQTHPSSTERPDQPRHQYRYAPYPAPSSATLPSRKLSTSSGSSVSLEFPPLSLHDGPRHTPSPVRAAERIQLPAIQQPATRDPQPVYALPPISALEDLRGVDTQDSAAVLRRLQSDDDAYSEPGRMDEQQRSRRRSLSAPTTKHSAPPTAPHRSLGHIPSPRMEYPKLRVSVPPDISRDGDSTCDPSPISPATPRSAVLGKDQLSLVPLSVLKQQSRTAAPYSFPVVFHNDWLTDDARPDSRISACRYSCMEDASDSTPLPLTSW
ncbi:hypothetical protein DFH08DRAFT_926744 [Mycena albidolilacea]|uniref:HTH APSES-type domain-containing protein n=1 Tax=Mycena albidolilacea TaxID=1033008 RepID=A0AAD6ZEF2_9AGAR|nr:hypothetical protein DFH08DRAFT_926744 [Mycena albidolilacea]